MHTSRNIHENFKVNMIRKLLNVNTAHGATLEPIGTAPLELNIDKLKS